MAQPDGGEIVGPIAEKTYGPGILNALRRFSRSIIGPKFEPMDLSGLNDQNDPPGLAFVPGGPTTQRGLMTYMKELQEKGLAGPLRKDRDYGARTSGDRSTTGSSANGAAIVDASRGIRLRKAGTIPLSDGASHPEAKSLLAEVDRQRLGAEEAEHP